MKNSYVLMVLLLLSGSLCALTGFGVSNVFSIDENTLPVELTSFTAVTVENNCVKLIWTSQSESDLQGYYIYRSHRLQLSEATLVSSLIQPTNTSTTQNYEYIDTELLESGLYYYWLYCMQINNEGFYYGPVSVKIDLGGNPSIPGIPLYTGLKSIFPNPFNPSTSIVYQVQSSADVKIEIFNTRGQLVNSFTKNHALAGEYTLIFSGVDSNGDQLSSGVYQVRMSSGKQRSYQKMVLMK